MPSEDPLGLLFVAAPSLFELLSELAPARFGQADEPFDEQRINLTVVVADYGIHFSDKRAHGPVYTPKGRSANLYAPRQHAAGVAFLDEREFS